MAGDGQAEGAAFDPATAGFDGGKAAVFGHESRDLTVLDDIDAERAAGAGIAPDDGIVPGDPCPGLVDRAENRKAGFGREIETRYGAADTIRVPQLRVHAVDQHGVYQASPGLHLSP